MKSCKLTHFMCRRRREVPAVAMGMKASMRALLLHPVNQPLWSGCRIPVRAAKRVPELRPGAEQVGDPPVGVRP